MDPSIVMAGANMVQGQMAQRQALGMNLAGMAWNTWMQNRQNEWNANQMALQNQWNIDQWNRENAYNTPLAQMQRLVAAGINPALAYSEGGLMNEAAASPAMQASQGKAYMVDPMSFAQIELMSSQAALANSQARKVDAETQYQQYLNNVEQALQKIPVGYVTTTSENGEEVVEIKYGNYHVELASRDLKQLGLNNQMLEYQLGEIYYNLAVATGSDIVPGPDALPSSMPNFEAASTAFKGDLNVRRVSSELADLSLSAAQAQNAGKEVYAKWLEENKDKPLVKLLLALQGFIQTLGITLPSFGGGSSQGFSNSEGNRYGYNSTATRMARHWFFKGR